MNKSNKGNLTETLDLFLTLIEAIKKELGINAQIDEEWEWRGVQPSKEEST